MPQLLSLSMHHLQVHLHVVLSCKFVSTHRAGHLHVFHVVLCHQVCMVCTLIVEASSTLLTPVVELAQVVVHVSTKAVFRCVGAVAHGAFMDGVLG